MGTLYPSILNFELEQLFERRADIEYPRLEVKDGKHSATSVDGARSIPDIPH